MFRKLTLGVLACALIHAQEPEKKKSAAPVINLTGAPPVDQAAADRGKKIFEPACGFCHGLDARGKGGPDLLRSTLVLHDENGSQIGAVIRAGDLVIDGSLRTQLNRITYELTA